MPVRSRTLAYLLVFAAVSIPAHPVAAQERSPAAAFPAATYSPSLAGAVVFSGAATGASLLIMPVDAAVRRRVFDGALSDNRLIHDVDRTFRWLGGDLPTAGSAAVWLTGLLIGDDGTADFGLHMSEALLAATVASSVAQRVIGRTRPYMAPHDPSSFSFGAGFGSRDHRSFPSGHAVSAFALAAGLTAEADDAWGEDALWVAVPAVAMATVTALSRVVDDQHWLSDVVAGAGLGTLAAVLVMQANGH